MKMWEIRLHGFIGMAMVSLVNLLDFAKQVHGGALGAAAWSGFGYLFFCWMAYRFATLTIDTDDINKLWDSAALG